MLKRLIMIIALIGCLGLGTSATAAIIEKAPDIGDYWNPLNSYSGTYIYANSFVAPENGLVSYLGMWLKFNGQGNQDIKFQIYGSIGGNAANGPDSTSILATTDVISGLSITSLTYYEYAALAGGTSLIAGDTYWFGASVLGLAGDANAYFNVGGHTQNTGGIVDNGTFWYSNSPNGINFDGNNYTPEMAFKVTQGASVPEPATMLLLGLGLAGIAGFRSRMK